MHQYETTFCFSLLSSLRVLRHIFFTLSCFSLFQIHTAKFDLTASFLRTVERFSPSTLHCTFMLTFPFILSADFFVGRSWHCCLSFVRFCKYCCSDRLAQSDFFCMPPAPVTFVWALPARSRVFANRTFKSRVNPAFFFLESNSRL